MSCGCIALQAVARPACYSREVAFSAGYAPLRALASGYGMVLRSAQCRFATMYRSSGGCGGGVPPLQENQRASPACDGEPAAATPRRQHTIPPFGQVPSFRRRWVSVHTPALKSGVTATTAFQASYALRADAASWFSYSHFDICNLISIHLCEAKAFAPKIF